MTQDSARTTDASATVLAIGLPGGLRLEPGRLGGAEDAMIRRGAGFHLVSGAHYALWLASLGAPVLSELLDWARTAELERPADLYAELAAELLLVTLSGEHDRDSIILREHRLHLLGYGLGNSLERPGEFRIGSNDLDVRASVDPVLYAILFASNAPQSLWQVCDSVADESRLTADDLRRHVLMNLGMLIASGVAVLDAL